jgi:hypothetical protein
MRPSAPTPVEATARRTTSDNGSALVITLMVLALVTALSTTVAVVTIDNLQGSWRAQQAGAALGAADAGVAQAMTHLRNNGVRDLKCVSTAPTSAACAAAWGSANPRVVTLPAGTGQGYSVWVESVLPFPTNDPGRYRIHATGTAPGQASRSVVADVVVTTTDVPKGIFARTISGGGNAAVSRESIFSTGCVYNRGNIVMSGIDVAYGIPVAVHSSQIITESTGSGQYCPQTNKPIHRSTQGNNSTALPCNTTYPYDQDSLGGALGSSCGGVQTTYPTYYGARDLDGNGTTDVNGSYLRDDASLFSLFGIKSPALSQSQLEQLKIIAQSQGNYWTQNTGWSSPDEANAVMYFSLGSAASNNRLVDLNDITGFGRAGNLSATATGCSTRSLIIVIDGGNAKLNSNQELAASLFMTSSAPYGEVQKANGTSNFIGTIYADSVNLVGTTNLSLDECFLSNVSPALLDFSVSGYRELDRS